MKIIMKSLISSIYVQQWNWQWHQNRTKLGLRSALRYLSHSMPNLVALSKYSSPAFPLKVLLLSPSPKQIGGMGVYTWRITKGDWRSAGLLNGKGNNESPLPRGLITERMGCFDCNNCITDSLGRLTVCCTSSSKSEVELRQRDKGWTSPLLILS